MKKYLLLVICLLFIVGCDKKQEKEIVSSTPEVEAIIKVEYKEDRDIVFLDKVKVSDFITSINGELVNDYTIDTTEIGNKKVEYEYINEQGIKVKQVFDINILDKEAPIIWVSGSYTLTKGENINVAEKIMCADNYDDTPNCTVEGKYDSNKVGSYKLKYVAIDSSGNKSTKDFVLNVVNPSKSSANTSTKSFSSIIKNYKNENTQIGIDVSKWQGNIDFDKLKAAGVEFIFIRVGYGTGQGKPNVVDEKFERNIKEANRVGIPVGIYYYSYADSKERAISDAKWVIEQLKGHQVDLGVAYDWERWGAYNDYKQSIYHMTENAKAFLDTLKDAGYEGLMYSSKVFLESIWYDTGYDVWLAHWISQTTYKGDFTYWQMCNNGKVDGISTTVDVNIRYLNK